MKYYSSQVALLSIVGIVVGNTYTYYPRVFDVLDLIPKLLHAFLEMDLFFDLAGMLGVLIYISCYVALQLNRVEGNSIRYCSANATAACLVLTSLIQDFNFASATIQIVWIVVSVYGIYRHRKSGRKSVERWT